MLPHHKGPVAEWRFEGKPVHQLNWTSLRRSLSTCETIVSILSDCRLLFPNTVRLSRWMKACECEVAQSQRTEKPDINISVHPSKPFVEVLSFCRSAMDHESVYPITIEIFGSGVIATGDGDSVFDDLVWVRGTTLDTLMITVATQADVWLPFSLEGQPQDEIYKLNADRLEDALQKIQRETDFKLEEGVESPYAVINGFRLDNVRYADGSLADVI